MDNKISIQKEIIYEINNAFKNKKINQTANYLTNNYLNQATNSGFLVKAIVIPRKYTLESSKNTGIWITNVQNDTRIFIPKNFVYDEDKSKQVVLIALPLFINNKKFNCFLRTKGSQRSKNIGIVKAYLFLLKINVFYYIEKGKEKLKQNIEKIKQVIDKTWNITENWVKKVYKKEKSQEDNKINQIKQKSKLWTTNEDIFNYQKRTEPIVEELDYAFYLEEFFNFDDSNLKDEHIFEFTEEELECLKSI
ncbi:hypothetical protein [Mycoplasma capricolum]|uniref:hypothetical protein n=1 Tax=Mycoplasma capricolum TaxID=2095 RepID=UPI003DA2F20E